MLKWLSRKLKKLLCTNIVQKIYVTENEKLAFIYYSGEKGSWSRTLRFIELYAPHLKKHFSFGELYGQTGIKYKGKLLTPKRYIVVANGSIQLVDRDCIKHIFSGGEASLKI